MIVGGYVYHVLNRANGRLRLFKKDADFQAFLEIVAAAQDRVPLRILGYVVMGNHWHFVVGESAQDQQVSDFFRWLSITHAQRWHAHHGTAGTGHVGWPIRRFGCSAAGSSTSIRRSPPRNWPPCTKASCAAAPTATPSGNARSPSSSICNTRFGPAAAHVNNRFSVAPIAKKVCVPFNYSLTGGYRSIPTCRPDWRMSAFGWGWNTRSSKVVIKGDANLLSDKWCWVPSPPGRSAGCSLSSVVFFAALCFDILSAAGTVHVNRVPPATPLDPRERFSSAASTTGRDVQMGRDVQAGLLRQTSRRPCRRKAPGGAMV